MWWFLVSLIWWSGAAAIPSPGPDLFWKCPEIVSPPMVECTCDMPHTLRCTGDKSAMQLIGEKLRSSSVSPVSLLDITIQNMTSISGPLLQGISLHGLVVSSGEIRDIHPSAFQGLTTPLQALGLPNNQLSYVPNQALISLPELDRLDLSRNRMKILESSSFKGLRNLSFIDLSNNEVTKISPNTFDNLPHLKVLRLRGNRITTLTLSKLNSLPTLEELDLSENYLIGPLGPKTFNKMESLSDLILSHNTFSSIKVDALERVRNLKSLVLHHNQIDVIEDHAFSLLGELRSLDLANNRIVAVSGQSLGNLNKLTDLDLRNNYLRALTVDLVTPLKQLRTLQLDDNEISIVASDAFRSQTLLKHLTLSDNPLNCDCSLTEFADWLNNSSLPHKDKTSASCATPPSLENGLLIEIPIENLLCAGQEEDSVPHNEPYKAKINLRDFAYDGTNINLSWVVDDRTVPYTCDALYIYEEEGVNEVLIDPTPLKCNFSTIPHLGLLNVSLPHSQVELQVGHKYRFCIVMLASGSDDDSSLVLGCSDLLPLIPNVVLHPKNQLANTPKVISILANLSTAGNLPISVNIYPQHSCTVNIAILEQGTLISSTIVPCSNPKYNFVGLQNGPYRVCANVIDHSSQSNALKPRCITVFKVVDHRGFTSLDIIFISIFLLLCFAIVGLIYGVRKVLLRSKITTHQCFLPPPNDRGESAPVGEQQHNRYVKLQQATTKL